MPNKKEILVLIISAILGALVTGGVIGSYFHYFQSQDQSPERLSSEGVVQKMIEKMAEVKSLEYSGQIEAEGEIDSLAVPFPLGGKGDSSQSKQPSPAKQKGKFSINFNGSSNIQDINNPKMQLKIGINTNPPPQKFTLEVRIIDKIGYLKLDDFPDLGFDASFLKGQWIKGDFKEIKKTHSKEVQKEEQELSPEQQKKIKEAITKAKIFKITKELQDEKIEGVDTHHYKFSIDEEKVIQLFIEISKIISPNESLNEKELKGSLTASLDNEAIESAKGEVWIGKKDFLLYKLLFSSAIKETEKTKSEGKLTIQTQFKNYHKPVQIDIPKPTKPFEEVLGALLGGALSKGIQESQPSIKWESNAPDSTNIESQKDSWFQPSSKEDIDREKRLSEMKASPLPAKITNLPAKHLFPAGSSAIISLKGNDVVEINWRSNLSEEEYKKCKNFGIKVMEGVEESYRFSATPNEGGIEISPANGKIIATIMNVEDFPIEVVIWLEDKK